MNAKQPRVKLGRLLLLFGIVNVGIVTLGFLGMALMMSLPTLRAFAWHIRNGNKFVIEGHVFHVPLRWNCTLERYEDWEISEDHPFSRANSSISITQTGKTMDSEAILRSQASLISRSNSIVPNTLKTVVIHGNRLNFLCVTGPHGDMLLCSVPDTDISVTASADQTHMAEIRTLLETSN